MRDKESTKRVVQLIAALCEAFNRTPSQATFMAYEVGLDGLSVEQIEAAVSRALRESRFMPSPAELRQSVATGTAANVDDIAQQAFAIFDHAVQSIGGYKSPNFSDPITNATVRALGGWNYLCEKPESEFLSFVRPQFLKTYAAFAKTGVGDEQSSPLVGIHDQKNLHAGHLTDNRVNVQCGIGYSREAVRLPDTKFHVDRSAGKVCYEPQVAKAIRVPVIIKPVPGEAPPADQSARLDEVMRVLEHSSEGAKV